MGYRVPGSYSHTSPAYVRGRKYLNVARASVQTRLKRSRRRTTRWWWDIAQISQTLGKLRRQRSKQLAHGYRLRIESEWTVEAVGIKVPLSPTFTGTSHLIMAGVLLFASSVLSMHLKENQSHLKTLQLPVLRGAESVILATPRCDHHQGFEIATESWQKFVTSGYHSSRDTKEIHRIDIEAR